MAGSLTWVLLAVALLAVGYLVSAHVEATTRDEDDVREGEQRQPTPDLSVPWER